MHWITRNSSWLKPTCSFIRGGIISVLIVLGSVAGVRADYQHEITPYFAAEYFTWEETDAVHRILKESGPLWVLGADADESLSWLLIREKVEIFGGVVGYSGETQIGSPADTNVDYFGARVEVDLGPKIAHAKGYLEPFGGVGFRWWLRDLQDTTAGGELVHGYTEDWRDLYLKAGGRGKYRLGGENAMYWEGGGKYPLATQNSIKFTDIGIVTLSPHGQWSGFAEAGITGARLQVALTYEGFRYAKSPSVQRQTPKELVTIWQPDSSSDIWGVKLGWRFK